MSIAPKPIDGGTRCRDVEKGVKKPELTLRIQEKGQGEDV